MNAHDQLGIVFFVDTGLLAVLQGSGVICGHKPKLEYVRTTSDITPVALLPQTCKSLQR